MFDILFIYFDFLFINKYFNVFVYKDDGDIMLL